MKKILSVIFVLSLIVSTVYAQHYKVIQSKIVYKETSERVLEMIIYKPEMQSAEILPAVVFYFGGGWVSGSPNHFEMQARYFASRGMITVCPDYRTRNNAKTTPFESVKDARSAMRFLKMNADNLGIDAKRIVAAGGSAGGHLAACTALINIDEKGENLNYSAIPFALILFNPVVDTSVRGYGQEKVDGKEFEISPVHHIIAGVPPTLIMHGKADTTVPYENVVRFKQAMKQEGNECTLIGYRHQTHGFFNFSKKPTYFKKTMKRTEAFLENKNLLKGSSWLKKYYKELKKK